MGYATVFLLLGTNAVLAVRLVRFCLYVGHAFWLRLRLYLNVSSSALGFLPIAMVSPSWTFPASILSQMPSSI